MREIDLKQIVAQIRYRLKWIILSVIVCAALLGSYAYFFMPEQYTSSVLVYVRNLAVTTDASVATTGNLAASERLVTTYMVAMTTDPVLQEASAKLGGEVSAAKLKGMVSSSTVQETAFLQLSVTNPSPDLARRACDAMAVASASALTEIGEVGSARVIGTASNAVKTSPNVTKNVLLGALIGLVLPLLIIVISVFTDNTISDKEDLQARLQIPVLGEIPSFDLVSNKKGGKKRG